jgi:hypothetical protein
MQSSVGAGLLAKLLIFGHQAEWPEEQKIAAFGSSYRGNAFPL